MARANLVNLTPHEITLVIGGREVRIPPSGVELRASQTEEVVDRIALEDGAEVEVLRIEYGEPSPPIEDLPGWGEGALYLVSSLAAQAVARKYPQHVGRFLVPARPLRDGSGRIVGAQALARIA
jgi:hypothetical protein